ncbi:MAG: hypothetical protein QOE17_364 [Gaiellales bacterium]|nr:hypothetical protein [Gaiellales bacterium]
MTDDLCEVGGAVAATAPPKLRYEEGIRPAPDSTRSL